MLRSVLASSLAVMLGLVSSGAFAQAASQSDPRELSHALDDAHYVRDVGAGLTLGGIALTGLSVGLMFGLCCGWEDWGTPIAGGVFAGLGGLAGLIGIPTWIVGGVRSDILARPEPERASVGWSYELAGIVTTLTGIGLVLVGGALMAADVGLQNTWPHDERAAAALRTSGAVMIPLGYFLATFIGPALWSEGARF